MPYDIFFSISRYKAPINVVWSSPNITYVVERLSPWQLINSTWLKPAIGYNKLVCTALCPELRKAPITLPDETFKATNQ